MKIKASELKVGDKILLDWWKPHHAAYITEIDINKIYYTPNWGHNSFFYTHAVESYERLEAFPKIKKVNVEDLKVGDKLQLTWYPEKEDTFKFREIKNIEYKTLNIIVYFTDGYIPTRTVFDINRLPKDRGFDICIIDECKWKDKKVEDWEVGDKVCLSYEGTKVNSMSEYRRGEPTESAFDIVVKLERSMDVFSVTFANYGGPYYFDLGAFRYVISKPKETKMLTDEQVKQIAKVLNIEDCIKINEVIKCDITWNNAMSNLLDSMTKQILDIATRNKVGFTDVKFPKNYAGFDVEISKEKSIDQLRKEVMEKLK